MVKSALLPLIVAVKASRCFGIIRKQKSAESKTPIQKRMNKYKFFRRRSSQFLPSKRICLVGRACGIIIVPKGIKSTKIKEMGKNGTAIHARI